MPADVPVPEDAAAQPDVALWPLQADDRVDAARHGRARTTSATWRCAISTSPAPTRSGRSGQSTPHATHLIKVACADGARQAAVHRGVRHRLPDPGRHLHARLHPRHRPRRAHLAALSHLRARRRQPDPQLRLRPRLLGAGGDRRREAGLRRRLSRSASRPRRPGDPAQIVAKADRIREELGWRPRHDDLDGIVHQALAWERALKTRNQR